MGRCPEELAIYFKSPFIQWFFLVLVNTLSILLRRWDVYSLFCSHSFTLSHKMKKKAVFGNAPDPAYSFQLRESFINLKLSSKVCKEFLQMPQQPADRMQINWNFK